MQFYMYTDQLIVTQILHLAQSIAIFVGLGSGLAKHNSTTTPEQWATSSKVSFMRKHHLHQLICLLPVHCRGRYSHSLIP
jgi:hypothetical protein